MAEDTQVRDHLAQDRTHLANERTFLSYVRTALALFLGAGFILKFESSPLMQSIAALLILFGGISLCIGTIRFISYRNRIGRDEK